MSEAYEKAAMWLDESKHRLRLFQWYFDQRKGSLSKEKAQEAMKASWKALNLFEKAAVMLDKKDVHDAANTFYQSHQAVQEALNILHGHHTMPAKNPSDPGQIYWLRTLLSNYYYQFQLLYKFYTEFQPVKSDYQQDALRHLSVMNDYIRMADQLTPGQPLEAVGRYTKALDNLMQAILSLHMGGKKAGYVKF